MEYIRIYGKQDENMQMYKFLNLHIMWDVCVYNTH